MYCAQCEWTPEGGCTTTGMCSKDADLNGLQELIIHGLKGVAAYGTHAGDLGYRDPDVDATIQRALYTTLTNVNFDPDDLLSIALDVGEAAIDVMALLDEAHTTELGTPTPTTVPQDQVTGRPILVTGHDLRVLDELLTQSASAAKTDDITVYTHSEMLPAHGYPTLNDYDHLQGNIGGAWHDQRELFADFPGPIVGTSNCLMPPTEAYANRFYTTGVTGLSAGTHIEDDDFTPVIEAAKAQSPVDWPSDQTITTGFHHTVLAEQVETILEAVESGHLRRIFVVAGCDGPTPGRDYYRELVKSIPEDCLILTSSCGKFRFTDLSLGTLPGTDIPRYIDLGQCNNSISAVLVAQELASALDCSVNDLPLSIVLSWFEQKAVAILLGLLHLGVEDIYLGPSLPEFLTEDNVAALNDAFGLQPITNPADDLAAMLGTSASTAAD